MRRVLFAACVFLLFAVLGILIVIGEEARIGTLEDVRSRTVEEYDHNTLIIEPHENFVGSEVITLKATDKAGNTKTVNLNLKVSTAPFMNELPDFKFTTASASSISMPLMDEILDDSPFESLALRVEPLSSLIAQCSIDGSGDDRKLKCTKGSNTGTQTFTLYAKDPDNFESSTDFSVEHVAAPAATFYKLTCKKQGRHCGKNDFSCPGGKGNPAVKDGCCPEQSSFLGFFASFGICYGINDPTIKYRCDDVYETVCDETCTSGYEVVSQSPCTPTCSDGTEIGQCSSTSAMRCSATSRTLILDWACAKPCSTNGCSLLGTKQCSGNNALECKADVGPNCLYWESTGCAFGCNSGDGQCRTSPSVCNPNHYRCYGDRIQQQQCNSIGSDWNSPSSCSSGNICIKATNQLFGSSPCEPGCDDGSTAVAVGSCIGYRKCVPAGGGTTLTPRCGECGGCPSGTVCGGDGTCGIAPSDLSIDISPIRQDTPTSGQPISRASLYPTVDRSIYKVCMWDTSLTAINNGLTIQSRTLEWNSPGCSGSFCSGSEIISATQLQSTYGFTTTIPTSGLTWYNEWKAFDKNFNYDLTESISTTNGITKIKTFSC